jgi:ubiquinone/menaquinone biosynthesis C-methylase UbiE
VRLGNAADFRTLERKGWGEKADSYGLLTGRITSQLVEPLLDAAGVAAGTRALDVGTGPGYAVERAADRGAAATGVDIAEEMVALARRRTTGVRLLRADAEDLPFAESSFDALVGNLVINHVPQPERAAREFARVLVPDGGIALSSWDVPDRNRFLGILLDAVRACGVTEGRAAGDPDPVRFADDGEFRELLSGTGFEDVEIRSISLTHRVADTDELWQGLLGGSVRTAGLVMSEAPATRTRVRAAVERLAEQYRADGGLVIPACAKIARGRKP